MKVYFYNPSKLEEGVDNTNASLTELVDYVIADDNVRRITRMHELAVKNKIRRMKAEIEMYKNSIGKNRKKDGDD